jgi:pimeloyl-ACP methyl ester carboxylesterase
MHFKVSVLCACILCIASEAVEDSNQAPAWYSAAYQPRELWHRRAVLTEEIQTALWQHQNPADCRGRAFAILSPQPGGLGSLVHVATGALAWAYENSKILVYGEGYGSNIAHGSYCNSATDFNCFFQPLSHCRPFANYTNAAPVYWSMSNKLVPQRWAEKWSAMTDNHDHRLRWRAQAAAYLMRLNERTAQWLQSQRHLSVVSGHVPAMLQNNTVSIHVRHGDKDTEMPLHSWQEHLAMADHAAAVRNFTERVIFLSTEDPAVVNEALSQTAWQIIVLPWDRGNETYTQVLEAGVSDTIQVYILLLV